MKIAENIKALRQEQGKSQEMVADALEITRQAVSRWERDISQPDTENLVKLAKYFNVSLERITGLTNVNYPIITEKKKCLYCHKAAVFYSDETKTEAFCSTTCQQLYKKTIRYTEKNTKWFGLGIFVSILVILIGTFVDFLIPQGFLIGGGMQLLGAVFIVFPFCTPETYQLFGCKKATWMGR
ncbi:MAG: helix-turn-helix domain-containing protein [Coprobacillaceae bacterium]